jgi:hypothetical protein
VSSQFDRSPSIVDAAIYYVAVVGMAAALTLVFLAMRAVMDVGGYCAEGGAYVIQVHCPDGAIPAMLLGIFGGIGCVGLVAWKGSGLGSGLGSVATLGWPALFGSLGWNFLEYGLGLHTAADGTRMEGDLGLVFTGVLFEVMALPVALFALSSAIGGLTGRSSGAAGSAGSSRTPMGGTAGFRPSAGRSPAGSGRLPSLRIRPAPSASVTTVADDPRTAAVLDGMLRAALAERVHAETLDGSTPAGGAGAGAAAAGAAAEVETLVNGLERLAALHASGAISDVEYATAKARLLAAADQ